jgi:hypothetical protein
VLRQADVALARTRGTRAEAIRGMYGSASRKFVHCECIQMRDGRLSAPTARILVGAAEDDTRLLRREALVQDGCVVLEASDGRDALTKVVCALRDDYAACASARSDLPVMRPPPQIRSSYIGGVSDRHPEQWDYYVCLPSCGSYQWCAFVA